jgi:hypothetical protein
LKLESPVQQTFVEDLPCPDPVMSSENISVLEKYLPLLLRCGKKHFFFFWFPVTDPILADGR